MSNTNTYVGSKIKGLRETKNLSIEEVAESTGLSVEQINSIENDQNLPSFWVCDWVPLWTTTTH